MVVEVYGGMDAAVAFFADNVPCCLIVQFSDQRMRTTISIVLSCNTTRLSCS